MNPIWGWKPRGMASVSWELLKAFVANDTGKEPVYHAGAMREFREDQKRLRRERRRDSPPITHAARVLLSRNHLYPGNTSNRLVGGPGRRQDVTTQIWLQGPGPGQGHDIVGDDPADETRFDLVPGKEEALLKLKRSNHLYRELGDGLANLKRVTVRKAEGGASEGIGATISRLA